jgi:hypothetical protein
MEISMSRTQYFVVLHEGQWKIKLHGRHTGTYPTQELAIKAAIDAAHETSSSSDGSQVLVQGEDHLFRTEWTYGHDPYPPSGCPATHIRQLADWHSQTSIRTADAVRVRDRGAQRPRAFEHARSFCRNLSRVEGGWLSKRHHWPAE